MRLLPLLAAAALLLAARPAAAQVVTAQDSTLVGLERVFVHFDFANAALHKPAAAAVQDTFLVALRKAGLRTAASVEELDGARDGVMRVELVTTQRGLSTDTRLRVDVRQAARLARTGRTAYMVTWFHERDGRGILLDDFAPEIMRKGVEEFLLRWRGMNAK